MKNHLPENFRFPDGPPRGRDNRGDQPLDELAWYEIFQKTQVPVWIEDISAVRGLIAEGLAQAGRRGLRLWLDAHPAFVGRVIGAMRVLDVNQAAVRLNAARSREELLVSLEKLVLPESLEAFKELICLLAADQPYYEGESRYRALDGREFHTLNRAWLPAAADPRQLLVIATTDITDLAQARRALAESEERYRLLIETARDVILRHDLSGRVTFVNQAGVDLLGIPREEFIGLDVRELLTSASYTESLRRKAAREAGETGVFLYEIEYQLRSGGTVPMEVSSTLLPAPLNGTGEPQVLVIARNIADRRREQQEQRLHEDRLRDAQKRESLGVLAGGIAHDFNNLLVTILGNAEIALEDLPADSDLRPLVAAIFAAGGQAAELCRQMQAYAGATPVEAALHDLSRLVAEIQHLLQATMVGGSRLRFELADGLPPSLIDAGQLRQVIMNMVNNASEAVGPEGGEIVIRTGRRDVGAAHLENWVAGADLVAGPHVFLEVRDTGAGMDQQTRSRMFEPFFTTRFTGRGLGMSAALGIVKGHGGGFTVESVPGRGTAVTFWLPARGGAVSPARAAAAPRADDGALRGRTVLLVDDDVRVRSVAESFLRRLGCRVLTAADGFDAIRLFGQRHAEIDVVIIDFTMPGLDGVNTSRRLRAIRSDIALLMSSGHDEESVRRRVADLGLTGFVGKPYNLRQLREALTSAVRAG